MAAFQEGLDRECEYPVNFGKYDLFENMKWLKTEVEKKQQQQYMEHRLKLYQQRCVRASSFFRRLWCSAIDAISPSSRAREGTTYLHGDRGDHWSDATHRGGASSSFAQLYCHELGLAVDDASLPSFISSVDKNSKAVSGRSGPSTLITATLSWLVVEES